ncbi:MAG: hypothetical protein LBP92_00790 [Deltaproteobacteria bacterium]|nr:hypothetical protein [Deltaproteobacteria bacterium]
MAQKRLQAGPGPVGLVPVATIPTTDLFPAGAPITPPPPAPSCPASSWPGGEAFPSRPGLAGPDRRPS